MIAPVPKGRLEGKGRAKFLGDAGTVDPDGVRLAEARAILGEDEGPDARDVVDPFRATGSALDGARGGWAVTCGGQVDLEAPGRRAAERGDGANGKHGDDFSKALVACFFALFIGKIVRHGAI